MQRLCVCPGSFDPITNGHLDVVGRALTLFDEVVVAVLTNPAKQGTFDVAERLAMIRRAAERLPGGDRVRVEAAPPGLLVDYCRQLGASAIVKGVRGTADVAYEWPMALMNRHLSGIETVFVPGNPAFEHVSSSLVREVASLGGDVSGLVPDEVATALRLEYS